MFSRILDWFKQRRFAGKPAHGQSRRHSRRFFGRARPANSGRTIFIGDVHGCLSELKAMINRLAPTPADRVILLGDLINRGPDSAGVVAYVAKRNFECLMGNHDYEYLSKPEATPAMIEFRKKIGRKLHAWLERRPFYIQDDAFVAVHAGLQPGLAAADTEPRILMNIRTWDGSGDRLNDPDNPPWYEYYTDRRPVFYGHWARKGLNLRENTIGLDSGCVYGRSLSAYVLETEELVQIKAAGVYYVPPSLRKQEQAG